jgi:hypothetical protein
MPASSLNGRAGCSNDQMLMSVSHIYHRLKNMDVVRSVSGRLSIGLLSAVTVKGHKNVTSQ